MRRIDLRKSKDLFLDMKKHIDSLKVNEVVIILFEIGDFGSVERSYEFIYQNDCELLNSLKFNQADWMICIRKRALI